MTYCLIWQNVRWRNGVPCAAGLPEAPQVRSLTAWRCCGITRSQKKVPQQEIEIIATEIDEHMLQRAADACYPGGCIKDVPRSIRAESFRKKEGEYCLNRKICDMVTFLQQDIRHTMPEGPFDLIFCKNLVGMYYTHEKALELFKKITGKLTDGGFLLIGNHEPFPLEELPHMTLYNRGVNMYRKKSSE